VHDNTDLLVQTVVVRALVPGYGSKLGNCNNQPCRDATRVANVQWIFDGGHSGIADEWLLRMPQGVAWQLAAPPDWVRNLLAEQPTALLSRGKARGAYRVTVPLEQACPVRTFIMTNNAVAARKGDVLPIPTHKQSATWTQIEGCGKLRPLPPPVSATSPQTTGIHPTSAQPTSTQPAPVLPKPTPPTEATPAISR
jgi:hypothetical protein